MMLATTSSVRLRTSECNATVLSRRLSLQKISALIGMKLMDGTLFAGDEGNPVGLQQHPS